MFSPFPAASRAGCHIRCQLQVELHFRHSVVAFPPHLTRCFCTCLVCLTLLLALWHLWCHFSFVLRALVTHCTVCPFLCCLLCFTTSVAVCTFVPSSSSLRGPSVVSRLWVSFLQHVVSVRHYFGSTHFASHAVSLGWPLFAQLC